MRLDDETRRGVEHGVHPLDPGIGIAWPQDVQAILSDKDAAAPSLDEAARAGLLPAYSDCTAFAARLREAAAGRPHQVAG